MLLYCIYGLAFIAGISLVTSVIYNKKLNTKTITRGANGVGGSTLNLSCPTGMTISFQNNNPTTSRAVYVCTNPDANDFEDQTCDPYYSSKGQLSTFFNPATTQDQSTNISAACAGKQSCQWAIPATISNICNGGPCTGTIQFISTYDCI